jgi:hypothetical protein
MTSFAVRFGRVDIFASRFGRDDIFEIESAWGQIDRVSASVSGPRLASTERTRTWGTSTRQKSNARSLHSTDHRFAKIYSGRDDRVGESWKVPDQASADGSAEKLSSPFGSPISAKAMIRWEK